MKFVKFVVNLCYSHDVAELETYTNFFLEICPEELKCQQQKFANGLLYIASFNGCGVLYIYFFRQEQRKDKIKTGI